MDNAPLISIVMNCFNGQTYLKKALDSVLVQTYQNWELIFWDNQSEDKSTEIFKSYKDKRFKFFSSSKHTILYEARNNAIQKTNGDLIYIICNKESQQDIVIQKMVNDNCILESYEEWDEDDDMKWILVFGKLSIP